MSTAKVIGVFRPKAVRATRRTYSYISKRTVNTVEMLDMYTCVTVQSLISEKEATEENGNRRSTTIQIFLSNPRHTRRITGFDEMADQLKAVPIGSVIEVVGSVLSSNGNGPDGFSVESLSIISKPEVVEQKETETTHELEQAASE